MTGRDAKKFDPARARSRAPTGEAPDGPLPTATEAVDELRAAGLTPEPLDARLPFHFAIRASKTDIQEDN